MSPLLNAVSALQLCAGCTVEFEPMVTLGAAEDPAGVGYSRRFSKWETGDIW